MFIYVHICIHEHTINKSMYILYMWCVCIYIFIYIYIIPYFLDLKKPVFHILKYLKLEYAL